MNCRFSCFLSFLVLSSITFPPANAALIVDGGFESPITFNGPPFVGFWEGFFSGPANVRSDPLDPHSGAQSLVLDVLLDNFNGSAGAFQDVPGMLAGQSMTFAGFHKSTSLRGVTTEVRIEWRNSESNTEIGRTPNSSPVPDGIYKPFSLTAVVPGGADTARVVYLMQSFGNARVKVDDVSLVPEPTSACLLGLGVLALALRRR